LNTHCFENGNVRMVAGRNGHFLFNKNDLFIGRSLETYGEWSEPCIAFLLKYLSFGNTVLDIGANIGTFTVPFATAVGETGNVHAFEPQRAAHQFLCANLALNGLQNVTAHNQGVGSSNSSIDVPVLDPGVPQNFGALRLSGACEDEPVRLITVDSLMLEACRLIKIDVEGMEGCVLDGAAKTIRRLRPLMFVENNNVDGARSIIQKVLDFDYQAWWVVTNYFNPKNFFGEQDNIFNRIQPAADMFCVPTDLGANIRGLEPVLGVDDHWKAAAERITARQKTA
jgi:FkbM family methyltransferase